MDCPTIFNYGNIVCINFLLQLNLSSFLPILFSLSISFLTKSVLSKKCPSLEFDLSSILHRLARRPSSQYPATIFDPSDSFLPVSRLLCRSRLASHGGEGGVGPAGVRSRVALKGESEERARLPSADISNAATYPAGWSVSRRGDARAPLENHPFLV